MSRRGSVSWTSASPTCVDSGSSSARLWWRELAQFLEPVQHGVDLGRAFRRIAGAHEEQPLPVRCQVEVRISVPLEGRLRRTRNEAVLGRDGNREQRSTNLRTTEGERACAEEIE